LWQKLLMRSTTHPTRRRLLKASVGAALGSTLARAEPSAILGQGDFRYRLIPGWGVLDEKTPVKNGHGIVRDQQGHLILLTDHLTNNVIIYDQAGRLVHKWGTQFPGAHGLSIVTEGTREVLFITCLQTHRVVKTTLDGQLLDEWRWPAASGKYAKETEFKPSWTLHLPDGRFWVLDGYGKDYITAYDAAGRLISQFGGAEGGIAHWGPHGGLALARDKETPELVIAMSDQQQLLRLGLDGTRLAQVDLPGGNPRQIRNHQDHFFVAHLADNWPADRQSRGFVSVLDSQWRVVSNIGGSAPTYSADGTLQKMHNTSPVFLHPHDLIVDEAGSLYVAQFASGNTYPLKFERV